MKTSIKLYDGYSVTIEPGVIGTARLNLSIMGVGLGGVNIGPEQAGAVIAALESCFPEPPTEKAGDCKRCGACA